ncbi:MAG TPA: DNA adenine methylase, partial [Candidatus Elarobacter sp.]|nr:DNA adenine methylase [Candidatus Elarobacter sp.]
MRRRPQPFPYQGSKRLLADRILALCGPGARFERLIEPFAGSAAIAVAALDSGIVSGVVINDALVPLAELWSRIIDEPTRIGDEYEVTWREQFDEGAHFERIRARFNAERSPADLLYVLARCVKAALRFNGEGEFNQSADRRRNGMKPERFRLEASAAARLLRGRSAVMTGDFRSALDLATPRDLVYLDPPYAGVSGRDRRYHAQIDRTAIVEAIERLNDARIPF